MQQLVVNPYVELRSYGKNKTMPVYGPRFLNNPLALKVNCWSLKGIEPFSMVPNFSNLKFTDKDYEDLSLEPFSDVSLETIELNL